MQEKHNKDKASNPLLLIIYVEGLAQQELLDISAD